MLKRPKIQIAPGHRKRQNETLVRSLVFDFVLSGGLDGGCGRPMVGQIRTKVDPKMDKRGCKVDMVGGGGCTDPIISQIRYYAWSSRPLVGVHALHMMWACRLCVGTDFRVVSA